MIHRVTFGHATIYLIVQSVRQADRLLLTQAKNSRATELCQYCQIKDDVTR